MQEIHLEENGLPLGFEDAIYVETTIKFSWRDRLKILLGAKVQLRTQTFLERGGGATLNGDNRLRVWLRGRRPKNIGYVEAATEYVEPVPGENGEMRGEETYYGSEVFPGRNAGR